jgi:hypothetical protein
MFNPFENHFVVIQNRRFTDFTVVLLFVIVHTTLNELTFGPGGASNHSSSQRSCSYSSAMTAERKGVR